MNSQNEFIPKMTELPERPVRQKYLIKLVCSKCPYQFILYPELTSEEIDRRKIHVCLPSEELEG